MKVASAYDPSKTAAKARTFLEVGAACRIIGNHVTDKDQYIGIEGKIKAVETKSFKRNYGYQVVLDGCKATPKIFAPEAVEAWDAGNLSQLTSGSQTQTQSQRGSSLSQLLLTSPAPVSSPPEKSSPNNPSQASSTTALISSKKTPQSRPNNETCTCEAHKNPTTLSEPFVQSQERCDFCVAKAAGKQRGGKKRKGDHLEKENAMDANVAATLELLRDELALKDSEIAKLKKKNEGMTQQVTNFRVEMKKYKVRSCKERSDELGVRY